MNLSSHNNSVTESHTVSLMCNDCKFDTSSSEVLERHVRTMHGTVSTESSTTKRSREWDAGDAEIFKSPKRSQTKCFFRQTKTQSGEFRIETRDRTSEVHDGKTYKVFGSFSCKPCGYKTMTKDDFDSHNQANHGGIAVEGKILEEHKGRELTIPSNDETVLNEGDFEPNSFTLSIMCDHCDLEMPSEQALNRHVRMMHGNFDIK